MEKLFNSKAYNTFEKFISGRMVNDAPLAVKYQITDQEIRECMFPSGAVDIPEPAPSLVAYAERAAEIFDNSKPRPACRRCRNMSK